MTRTLAAAAAMLLGGCLTPTAQTCGDLLCPADALCVDGARCVTHDAVTACMGMSTGTACEIANQYGRCTQESPADIACEPAACGDGVIDAPLHEVCDGAAPIATQCVDLGYDLGLPGCTAGCALDPAPCTRFGWEVAVDAPVSAMWTDGTVLAYARHDPDRLVVQGGGFALELAMTITELHGGGGRVVARASDGTLYDVTPAGTTPLAMPPQTPSPRGIGVDDAGALYALGTRCAIWKERGGWTKAVDDQGACSDLFVSGSHVFGVVSEDHLVELVAGALVPRVIADGAIRAVRMAGAVGYLATTDSFSRFGASPDLIPIAAGDARSIAIAGTSAYAAFGDGHGVRWDGRVADPFTPPTAALADDGHGHVFSFIGPIYRYSGAMFGDLAPLSLAPTEAVIAASATPDGVVFAAAGDGLWLVSGTGTGWTASTSFGVPIHAMSASSATSQVAATYDATHPVRLQRRFASTWGTETPPGATAIDGVWLAPSGVAYAAGQGTAGGWLGFDDPSFGPWTKQDVPGCAFFAVDGRVDGITTRVVAAGECDSHPAIWELSGGTWTEIDRDSAATATLRAVRVLASGDIVATGDQLTRWQVGGAWRSSLAIHGRSLAGETDDVWISGSFTPVEHWDGHAWSKVTTRPLGPIALAVTPSRVVMAGAAVGHVALLRE